MSGRVNVRYGLNQGARIMVTRGKEKKKSSRCKGVPVPYSDGLGKVQVQCKQS